uniref:Uncharacterized protein n=1 Tax=Arundo donax TaxID=35708 RepID=A0A0A9FAJ7_ARUDO
MTQILLPHTPYCNCSSLDKVL